jgi:hypothetical protein
MMKPRAPPARNDIDDQTCVVRLTDDPRTRQCYTQEAHRNRTAKLYGSCSLECRFSFELTFWIVPSDSEPPYVA